MEPGTAPAAALSR